MAGAAPHRISEKGADSSKTKHGFPVGDPGDYEIRQPGDHGIYGPPDGFRWADAPN